ETETVTTGGAASTSTQPTAASSEKAPLRTVLIFMSHSLGNVPGRLYARRTKWSTKIYGVSTVLARLDLCCVGPEITAGDAFVVTLVRGSPILYRNTKLESGHAGSDRLVDGWRSLYPIPSQVHLTCATKGQQRLTLASDRLTPS